MSDSIDAIGRFSDRADLYGQYRPEYPAEMFAFLLRETGLRVVLGEQARSAHAVADLGSGTGILSEPFLQNGLTVYGVEPNANMRAVAEAKLQTYDAFRSVDGRAEATGLESSSVDLAVAGQAFHWFNPQETRDELRRILKPGRMCALIWNERATDTTPFLREYEKFLRAWGTDYHAVSTTYEDPEAIAVLLGTAYARRTFENSQTLDQDALRGRILSASYIPAPRHPRADAMLEAVSALFNTHQEKGAVQIHYNTQVYLGQVSS